MLVVSKERESVGLVGEWEVGGVVGRSRERN